MESAYSEYVLDDSVARLDEILAAKDAEFSDSDSIPSRNLLTFTNGYYVSCSVLFVDMRSSKTLAQKYKKPTLAKLYRGYISELIAVFKGDSNIQEISIEGDCVWGVFNTPYKADINQVFGTAAKAQSLVNILNRKLVKVGVDPIRIGIGISYGDTLMIKSGYKNSGINEVTWMGHVVSEAARLCSYGNREWFDNPLMVTSVFYDNLNDHNKNLLSYNNNRQCYHGNVINKAMEEWLKST